MGGIFHQKAFISSVFPYQDSPRTNAFNFCDYKGKYALCSPAIVGKWFPNSVVPSRSVFKIKLICLTNMKRASCRTSASKVKMIKKNSSELVGRTRTKEVYSIRKWGLQLSKWMKTNHRHSVPRKVSFLGFKHKASFVTLLEGYLCLLLRSMLQVQLHQRAAGHQVTKSFCLSLSEPPHPHLCLSLLSASPLWAALLFPTLLSITYWQ